LELVEGDEETGKDGIASSKIRTFASISVFYKNLMMVIDGKLMSR